MNLTNDQLDAVERGEAVRLANGGTPIVVLRADVFDRLAKALYDDAAWTPDEMARLAWQAGASIGWGDPEMDVYDDYEQHRP